ncbi:hypothetical protein SPI_08776 [Niveomyces insectorum RCEF 264]|uniref:Uncharacterized protein n=1 Tax=Niveomyces insectorum RCEF 264 TaxID=1081102 RepID=A0A162MDB2_9HYPO|nr:hypothetical protein SPI_08776 [Niveomyces insectorum RCEF 264]
MVIVSSYNYITPQPNANIPFILAAIGTEVAVVADTLQIIGWTGLFTGTIASCATRHCRRELLNLDSVPRANVGRDDVGPCNVPMYNFYQCRDELHSQGQPVVTSTPAQGVAQFDNIPPACMDLAGVLAGTCTGVEIRPTPCGSACMQYTGLSSDQMRQLALTLQGQF